MYDFLVATVVSPSLIIALLSGESGKGAINGREPYTFITVEVCS